MFSLTVRNEMELRVGNLRNKNVIALLNEHHEDMLSSSPPESVHALDLTELEKPEITFFSLWIKNELAGFGALKELDQTHGEIKSMRTSNQHLRKGVARKLLQHIIDQAKRRSYKKLKFGNWFNGRVLTCKKALPRFRLSRV